MFPALLEWKVYCGYKILNLHCSFVGRRSEGKKSIFNKLFCFKYTFAKEGDSKVAFTFLCRKCYCIINTFFFPVVIGN